jgi:hypothetical protein
MNATRRQPLKYNKSNMTLFVVGKLGVDYQEIMFVFNIIQMFSYSYQLNNTFGIHSGAVKIGDKVVLLLGGEEAGKSSITAMMCANFDSIFLNDERAIIKFDNDCLKWLEGNSVLRLREIPSEINKTKFNNLFVNIEDKSKIQHKFTFGLNQITDGEFQITDIIFVRLSNYEKFMKSHHEESALYKLFAILSEDIHGSWAPILGAKFAMPSIDLDKLCQLRLKTSIDIVYKSNINLWTCKGSVNDICQMIVENIN